MTRAGVQGGQSQWEDHPGLSKLGVTVRCGSAISGWPSSIEDWSLILFFWVHQRAGALFYVKGGKGSPDPLVSSHLFQYTGLVASFNFLCGGWNFSGFASESCEATPICAKAAESIEQVQSPVHTTVCGMHPPELP